MSSYTPGPWTNRMPQSNFEKGHATIRPQHGEKNIASITKNYTFSENEANAKLISAAPDLVDALKRLSFMAQTSGGTAGRDDELVKAIEQAGLALAKAGIK